MAAVKSSSEALIEQLQKVSSAAYQAGAAAEAAGGPAEDPGDAAEGASGPADAGEEVVEGEYKEA